MTFYFLYILLLSSLYKCIYIYLHVHYSLATFEEHFFHLFILLFIII